MRKRKEFTLTEIAVVSIVLSLFLGGLFALYSGSQTASGVAFWIQKTATALRNATRHISTKVQQSSYPTTVIYPSRVIENTSQDYNLRVNEANYIIATACTAVTSKNDLGTKLLWFIEALPERRGFEPEEQAKFYYHIYSLSNSGKLLYHRFQKNIPFTADPNYIKDITTPKIPPDDALLVETSELVEDVESVRLELQENIATGTPIKIEINCKYPRGNTRRSDVVIVVPNVAITKEKP